MAYFTVRVQLENADGEDYEKLHELMAASGYSREITGDNGKIFKLPDAEYNASKNATEYEVRDEVKKIAELVKQEPIVLVTKSSGRAWYLSVK